MTDGWYYKRVLMPIDVPAVDYCWDHVRICGHFDNEGGHPSCDLNVGSLYMDKEGLVPKPKKCLKFSNI